MRSYLVVLQVETCHSDDGVGEMRDSGSVLSVISVILIICNICNTMS